MKNQTFHGFWLSAVIISASFSASLYKYGESQIQSSQCVALASDVAQAKEGRLIKFIDFVQGEDGERQTKASAMRIQSEMVRGIELVHGKTLKECGGYYPL